MSAANDQHVTELTAAAQTFIHLLPHPAGVGGLLMLYGDAINQSFTFQQLSDCFGDENLDIVGFAYAAARECWDARHHSTTRDTLSWDEVEAGLPAATDTAIATAADAWARALAAHESGAEQLP